MKKILEAEQNPSIQTFNNMAIPISVLSPVNPDNCQLYLYQYGIPIFYSNENVLFDCLPFRQWDCFDCEEIESEAVEKSGGLIDMIMERLCQGRYVYAPVNEKYIPQRKSYGREDFNHDILIYGVDTEEGVYHTLACNIRGQYRKQLIPIQVIQQAFDQLDFEDSDDLVFFLPQNFDGQNKDLLLHNAMRACARYLHCESPYKFPNHFYGTEVYEALIAYIQTQTCRELDMRNFRLLYEQKQMISSLLDRAEEPTARAAYGLALDEMRMAFNLALKFNLKQEDSLLTRIFEHLRQCKDAETTVLQKWFSNQGEDL